jgi:hypothetical protein
MVGLNRPKVAIPERSANGENAATLDISIRQSVVPRTANLPFMPEVFLLPRSVDSVEKLFLSVSRPFSP